LKPIDSLLAIPEKGIHALGVIFVAGMIVGTGSYIYSQMTSRSSEMDIARTIFTQSRSELQTHASSGVLLRDQVGSLQERVDHQPQLVSAAEYNSRSANIAASAEQAGIRIDVLQPEEQQSEGLVSWIPVQCSGHGSVDSLMSWIEQMEESWPDIVVHSIGIDTGESDGQFRLQLLFRWYVLVDQAG
jgi:Tfp pilus assembly protein PilO